MDKTIAIVQHEPSVPPGLIAEVFDREGIEYSVVEAWAGADWPETRDLAGLVTMGGTMNVDQLDEFPFLKLSRQLMADALEADVPILGVCLGSQMLARVLGFGVQRRAPRNVAFAPVILSPEGFDDPLVSNFEAVPVLQFHEDTFELPTGAVALATSATASPTHQAFRYGGSAYGIQFHFEVDAAIVKGWCRDIGPEKMQNEWGVSEDDLLADSSERFESQRAAGTQLIEAFLLLCAEG